MSFRVFSCQTCELSFGDAEAYRAHAKSNEHVVKLQEKVAGSGAATNPQRDALDSEDPTTRRKYTKRRVPDTKTAASGESETTESDDSNTGDEEEPQPTFVTEQCLFCSDMSDSLQDNVVHMFKTHGFKVPFEDSLAVDLETLLWYIHLVVFGYRECVFCGTHRNTVEAVQQHMCAKAHCRFEPVGEYADFYDMTVSTETLDDLVQPDESSLRLPSGKLLSHRSHSHQAKPANHRNAGQSAPQADALPASKASSSTALSKSDRVAEAVALQVSRLSANDQRSLAHLSSSEQRAILATQKKQLDISRRQERRAQLKAGRAGNKTLMKHFKIDVPGRNNG